jgi:hypothetical protein
MSFWSDLVGTIEQIVIGNPAGVSAPGGPAVSAVKDASTGQLFGFLGAWAELTDGKLWRSLGWLLLGVALMFLGVLWWIGPSASRASPVGLAARQLG